MKTEIIKLLDEAGERELDLVFRFILGLVREDVD